MFSPEPLQGYYGTAAIGSVDLGLKATNSRHTN
jgi:hypothetical protein